MSGHTPGPWFYSQESIDPEWYIVTIKGGLIVANVNADSRQVANARLIAAAPVMLGLLEELIDIEGPCPGTAGWAEKVRSTISAAKGGAS